MSKKMLKRSLALGALMAFVITGSAYAENFVGSNYEVEDWHVSETFTIDLKEDSVLEGGIQDINDGHVVDGKPVKDTWILNLNDKKLTSDGEIYIAGGILDINGDAGSVLEINANRGISVAGDIDVDTMKIDSTNAGAYLVGLMTIDANLVDIKSDKYGFLVQGDFDVDGNPTSNGELILKANTLKIDAGYYALRAAHKTNVDVNTNIIELKSETGNKVSQNANLKLSAKSGTVNSPFIVEDNSNLELTFGKDVVFDGIISTVNTATSELILNGTWNNTGASTMTNATFNSGSTFVIDGEKYIYDSEEGAVNTYALNGVGDKATLTVENGAKLKINGITETTYNIAQGFANLADAKDKWEVSDINTLMQGVAWTSEEGLQVKVFAKDGGDVAEDLGVSEATGDFLSNLAKDAGDVKGNVEENTAEGKLVGLAKAAAESNNPVVVAKAAEAVQKMAEAGGNSATAANVVTNVTNVTGQRLSFSGGNAGGNKGGHGVGLLEEGSGAAIWAQYVHGKDSVEDMPSEAGASSYEGQYNGIVMGVDFKKVGKFQSGIAFNYGEGDTNSVNTTSPTRSEYDFWGVGYYGNIRNADSNVIFDIGYAKTDSDVTSNVNVGTLKQTYEASPETTTWTAGVKVEKLYQNNNVQIVPYTGLRYMSIDPEDYTTKCGAMGYKMERQDIWLLPVGVSIKQEIVNPNGWVVTPKVDLSYIWAFGDTDSSMETNTVFGSDNRPIGYDVMDEGSWMGLVGVEAAMDDWTFGVSYSYQKGDHSESKKWYVDAKYSF